MFEVSCIYESNYNLAKAGTPVVINQGGTSSGKTYSIMQVLFTIAMEDSGSVITVVGQDVPNLKKGAYRDAKTIYYRSSTLPLWFTKNETDRIFTCLNGSIIEFTSYQDEQDAKSGKRDYLFINEANGIIYPIYQQLSIRTRKTIFIDFNPSSRFWAHDELIGKDGVKRIISDHRHNPFLSQTEHDKIEKTRITDPEFFKVYGRGRTGKIQGVVYHNWQLCGTMPEHYKFKWYGLDFGFTNDVTALIEVRVVDGELWLKEIIYERGLTNPDIAERVKENGITRNDIIIADSAEMKSIEELKRLGLRMEAAVKGPGSIKFGIDILRRWKMNICRDSANLRDELNKYQWRTDKNGLSMNEPIDFFNHLLDATRYVALNKLQVHRLTGAMKMVYK